MDGECQVAALWIGGPLSYLEQLCLKSFVDAGQAIRLYAYDPVANLPEGVETADAAAILPRTAFLRHGRTGSPALHSDLFRYHLLAKADRTIWADTDAYCVRPFATRTGHFHAWESATGINGGVLGLPRDSATLAALVEFTRDEHPVPPWLEGAEREALVRARDEGRPVHVADQPWGVWGPHALTHFLKATGEVRHTMPMETLYPFAYGDRNLMLRPGFDAATRVTDRTVSIHFYGRRMRARILEREPDAVPRPRSLIGQLLRRHGIDPALAPLVPRGEAVPADG